MIPVDAAGLPKEGSSTPKRAVKNDGCQSASRATARSDLNSAAVPDAAAHAAYIRDMVFELRSMAEKHNMTVLAYFIDMAYEEASNQMRGDS